MSRTLGCPPVVRELLLAEGATSPSWSRSVRRVEARRAVTDRGLLAVAVRHLTEDALGELPFEALGPTKALLKRFFSSEPWTDAEDQALAEAVGPGAGWWSHPLDEDLVLEFGWSDGRFRLEVTAPAGLRSPADPPSDPPSEPPPDPVAATFSGPVTPEATPNPRTVMFRTGDVHEGQSRPFTRRDHGGDARVSRLFQQFPDVSDVLVATDFVAVSLRRPDRWEALLAPVLQVVAEEFAGDHADAGAGDLPTAGGRPAVANHVSEPRPHEGRLQQAWRELGSLRPGRGPDLERVRAAAMDAEAPRRQVAASLLREADPGAAKAEWERLLRDRSRLVRRATVDAIVDVAREELRPLLETALTDGDAWVRWKALRGLAELGVGPSRHLVNPLATDPDFRVRLEARAAVRDR